MGDETQGLNIAITSTADTSGFKQASAAQKSLKVDTSDLSDETKRSLGMLPSLQDAHKESGKAAEESGISHRELGKALAGIGNVTAPGAGRALRELAYGPVGAALALLEAYQKVQEAIENVDKAAEALNEEEMEEHHQAVENIKTAWLNAREAIIKYHEELKKEGEDQDPLATHLARIQAVSAAQVEANLKVLESQQKITLEWMKTHGATDAQIGAQEAKNREEIERTRDKASNKSTGDIQADVDERKKQQPTLIKAAEDAINADSMAGIKLDKAKEDQKKAYDLKKAQAAEKAVQDAQAALESAKSEPEFTMAGNIAVPNTGREDRIKQAQEGVNQAIANEARLKASQDAADKAVQKAADEKTKAAVAAEEAQKREHENAGKIQQEQKEVETRKDVEDAKHKGEVASNAVTTSGKAIDLEEHAQNVKEATAALAAGIAAQRQIILAVKTVGDSNIELHKELEKQFALQRQQNIETARKIAQIKANSDLH